MPKKEYIERVALIKFAMDYIPNIHGDTTMKSVKRALKAAPAADDVVEVVRCKDCVCFKQTVSALFPHATAFICDFPYGLQKNVSENDFCCHGERKEQNEIP